MPRVTQRVGDTRDERRFRSDDDKFYVVVEGVFRHDIGAGGIEGDDPNHRGDPGVPGGGSDVVGSTLREEGRDDRVLARAGTENENSHGTNPTSLIWWLTSRTGRRDERRHRPLNAREPGRVAHGVLVVARRHLLSVRDRVAEVATV